MSPENRTTAVIGLGHEAYQLAVGFGKKRLVIGFDIKADLYRTGAVEDLRKARSSLSPSPPRLIESTAPI